jgi:hypothetical protein
MIFRHKKDHSLDYLILLLVLATGALVINFFDLTKTNLLFTSLLVSAAYVFWGVTHHKKAGHIDKKIVLEYCGLALLVNVIIFSLIN